MSGRSQQIPARIENFFLRNAGECSIVCIVRPAEKRMDVNAVPVLWKLVMVEFTLPMLVIRDYVLEP